MKTITVLGAGYVGLTTATLLANVGYKTYLIEPVDERRNTIASGKSFFFEEGLDPLIKQAISSKKLLPTNSYETAIPESDIVISCVGTPDKADGSSNLDYVFGSARETISLANNGLIYVQKSTVPVGTGIKIKDQIGQSGKNIAYVSNPEFLREGTALYDTLFFDRIVVGGDDAQANDVILDLYRDIESKRDKLAKTASLGTPELSAGRYVQTSLNSAELIKVTANAFLALKISFANSIAKLADAADADVVEVMDAVGLDKRIGRAFLNAGRGYGGGCFPKDVSGLISSAESYGVEMPIMRAAQGVNEHMADYVVSKVPPINKTVAVLGLSFKSGTSDTRKSPGIKIANLLAESGRTVFAYDPKAMDEAREELNTSIKQCDNLDEALAAADTVVLAVDWPEFANTTLYTKKTVIDAMNMLPKGSVEHHIGIGR